MSKRGRNEYRNNVNFMIDRDVFPEFVSWMDANNLMPGEEHYAIKTLIRIGLSSNPASAYIQQEKVKAFSRTQHMIFRRLSQFFGELNPELRDAIQQSEGENGNL